MYVDKLTIRNYRCFASAETTFNYPGREPRRGERLPERYKNVTLLIGPNGSGKTSVCSALCLAVLAPIIRNSGLRVDYFLRRPPGYKGDQADTTGKPERLPNADIIADLKLSAVDTETLPKPGTRVVAQAVIRRQADFEDITTAHNNLKVWERIYKNDSPAFFVAAYGSNRRAANPEGYSERSRSPRYQRVASIFEEYFGLVPLTVGYLELEQSGRLEEARSLLNQLLPDGVTLTEERDREKRPLFQVFGVFQPFSALSDGYRGFVSWVWDLLVQMARVLPSRGRPGALRELTGIVIVDEVDMFLHPRWQRFLIEELSDTFENLQFIFSTHSPLVVGMLQKENLRVVRDWRIEQYQEEVEGKTPNELLTSAYFGLSSTRSRHSGTLSEQMEREMGGESTGEDGLAEVNEAQRQELRRMMAQSGQYRRALREVEQRVRERSE